MPKTLLDQEFDDVTGGASYSNDQKSEIESIVRKRMETKPIECKTCGKSHYSFTNFALPFEDHIVLKFSCGHTCRYTYKEAGVRVL